MMYDIYVESKRAKEENILHITRILVGLHTMVFSRRERGSNMVLYSSFSVLFSLQVFRHRDLWFLVSSTESVYKVNWVELERLYE